MDLGFVATPYANSKNVICHRSNGCKAKMCGRLARKPCMTVEADQFELTFRLVPKYTGRTDGGHVKRPKVG